MTPRLDLMEAALVEVNEEIRALYYEIDILLHYKRGLVKRIEEQVQYEARVHGGQDAGQS